VNLILKAIEGRLFDVHTGLPARVVSFDPSTQRADVQPLLQRVMVDEDENPTTVTIPVITNVPIQYPSGAGWSITWPLAPGDIVYLTFSERSLDEWLVAPPGNLVTPAQARKFDLSDAVILAGIRPRTSPVPNISATSLRIANDAENVAIELAPTAVNITAPTEVNVSAPVVNINSGVEATMRALLGEAVIAWLASHTHVGAPSGALPVTPAQIEPSVLQALLAATKIS
jgi:hypothetical protein